MICRGHLYRKRLNYFAHTMECRIMSLSWPQLRVRWYPLECRASVNPTQTGTQTGALTPTDTYTCRFSPTHTNVHNYYYWFQGQSRAFIALHKNIMLACYMYKYSTEICRSHVHVSLPIFLHAYSVVVMTCCKRDTVSKPRRQWAYTSDAQQILPQALLIQQQSQLASTNMIINSKCTLDHGKA